MTATTPNTAVAQIAPQKVQSATLPRLLFTGTRNMLITPAPPATTRVAAAMRKNRIVSGLNILLPFLAQSVGKVDKDEYHPDPHGQFHGADPGSDRREFPERATP